MFILNATDGQVIDLVPAASGAQDAMRTTLFKSERMQIVRLTVPRSKVIPTHKAPAEITVQCLQGRAEFTALGKTQELIPGQMIHLPAGVEHSVKGVEDSCLVVTIVR